MTGTWRKLSSCSIKMAYPTESFGPMVFGRGLHAGQRRQGERFPRIHRVFNRPIEQANPPRRTKAAMGKAKRQIARARAAATFSCGYFAISTSLLLNM